jgi:hypothetical protein
LGFVEIGMELEPIESTIQLSSLKNIPKQYIHSFQEQSNRTICCSSSIQTLKRTPRIIGRRGTRDTEFFHPSSLAYSKQDQLICKISKKYFLF